MLYQLSYCGGLARGKPSLKAIRFSHNRQLYQYRQNSGFVRFQGPRSQKALQIVRFQWRNILLREMVQSSLIEIDDPSYPDGRSDNTYYSVPNYVWKWVERVEPDYQSTPVPEDAPWKYPKSRLERIFYPPDAHG